MAFYRILMLGRWKPAREGTAGFFTTRTARGHSADDAANLAAEALRREWVERPFFERGHEGLELAVIDVWRVGWFRAWRTSSGGHSFFDDEVAGDAARLEAEAAGAPTEANIWKLASLRGSTGTQFFVFEPDT